MGNMFQGVIGLMALVIIFAIVFVKAGQFGGATGGSQSAGILKAGGGALSDVITALEGGTGGPSTHYPV